MNTLADLLLGWLALAAVGYPFALWFGWHLNRRRGQHTPPHVHTRALWLAEREQSDRSEPSGRRSPNG